MCAQTISQSLQARPVVALPVAEMVVGKSVTEAAELLPRLFNLCRTAQAIAARAAFGLPQDADWQGALQREIFKEHILKLCLKWPGQLSLASLNLPPDWREGGGDVRRALFGSAGTLPATHEEFITFLETDVGIAPVLKAIDQLFAPFEAIRAALPLTSPMRVFEPQMQENSVAARHASHPVLRGLERSRGRGPLWTATAVALDAEACLTQDLPAPQMSVGRAVVPAARGLYGVEAEIDNGRVARFRRITPTDHLLVPGGSLDQSLATLAPKRARALAPLLLSILDPCFPVKLEHVQEGVAADA